MSSANVEGMIREAIRAYRAGNKPEARKLLEKATELDAYNEQAWMWLSAVVETPEDQRVCLENVLIINPNNDNAKRGLAMLSGASSAPPPAQASPPKEDFSIPPTATSSPSAIYNPANEVSKDEYDDWVAGLNLGGSSSASAEDEPTLDHQAFANAFAGAFDDDDFDDDGFDETDLRQMALAETDHDDYAMGSGNDDLNVDTLFEDEDDFLPGGGPFTSQAIGLDLDLPDDTTSKPPTSSRARASAPASPVPKSPVNKPPTASSTAFVEDTEFDTMSAEPDPGEFFRAIPKDIKPTRLPGTNEKYSPVLLAGLVVLITLNLGALVMLVMNLGG